MLHGADLNDPNVGAIPSGPDPRRAAPAPRAASPGAGASPGGPLIVRFHGGKNAPPSANLYVKGIPANASDAQLQELFGRFGVVTSMRLMPGAADSAALVRMGSMEEA